METPQNQAGEKEANYNTTIQRAKGVSTFRPLPFRNTPKGENNLLLSHMKPSYLSLGCFLLLQ